MTAESPPTDETFAPQHGWLEPGEISLDAAMNGLGDAGFAVTHFPEGFRAVEAEISVGVHHARVSLVEGKYLLVEQQRSQDDGRRIVVDEWWPDTVAAAVERAVKLAGELAKAHEAAQSPAVIGDELEAEATDRGAAA